MYAFKIACWALIVKMCDDRFVGQKGLGLVFFCCLQYMSTETLGKYQSLVTLPEMLEILLFF